MKIPSLSGLAGLFVRRTVDEQPVGTLLPGPTALLPDAQVGVASRSADPQPDASRAALAPWPSIDRYPVILGSNVSLTSISSVFRLSLTGYRREFCDLLDELLERDPHMYCVVAQRVHAVAGARVQILPADTEEGSADEKRAQDLASYVERRVENIPDWQQSIAQLQWGGLFYGVGCSEISWRIDDEGFFPARLHRVHSRPLAYPDPVSWSVRIWDQGMVASWDVLRDPTAVVFGVRCEDFPGKFMVHTPSVRGNYPTRDGLGRECAYWSALKLMGARGASQFIERFGKPWVIGRYTTVDGPGAKIDGDARAADKDDIIAVDNACKALGAGSLASAIIPNSTAIDVSGPAVSTPGRNLMHAAYINMCNAEISKAALGQTDTTDASPNGSRASTQVRKDGTKELYRYDAACMADTLGSSLFRWLVRLKRDYRPDDERLVPTALLHAAEEPDLDAMLKRATELAKCGAEVDADKVAEQCGVPMLAKPEDGARQEGRTLYNMAPLKPYEVQQLVRMNAGEELDPPPKLTDPFAEGGGGASSAEGAGGPGGKPPGAKAVSSPPSAGKAPKPTPSTKP